MSDSLLEVRSISRAFGAVQAVRRLSFAVEPGQVCGFIGPNGAGKTTTMRIIATLDLPDGGDVLVNGHSVLAAPRDACASLGFMADHFQAYPNLSVHEFLDFMARANGIRGYDRRRAVSSVEGFCGLEELLHRSATGLSKGMGQRLHLARTLLHDPSLLVLDEPAAGLDPRARVEFRSLVRELADSGKAILISSHLLAELEEICDAVIMIEQGALVAGGGIADIARDMQAHRAIRLRAHGDGKDAERLLLTQPGIHAVVAGEEGVTFDFEGDDEALASLLRLLVEDGVPVYDFRRVQVNLEELFLRATEGKVRMTDPDKDTSAPIDPAPAEAVEAEEVSSETAVAPEAGSTRLDRFAERVVDRLNPILVREVRQAVNGRGFAITAGLALLATVLIGLFAAAAGSTLGKGGSVFIGTMEVLAPIVLFVVPLQAFLSTRHEVTRGTVEHLLLSRLTPGRIVRGKLAAATVQFVMYLGIFSPLLALTFLLRGVDIPTIAWALVLALMTGLAASSLAVACGALSRWPNAFRVLPVLLLVGGLIFLTWGAMAFVMIAMFDISRVLARGQFWTVATGTVLPAVGTTVLCGLVGSAALSHPYENRSTGFRAFAVALLLGVFAWMLFVAQPAFSRAGGMPSSAELWYTSAALAGVLGIFALFAATEAPKLTPRVATSVPRSDVLRFLSVPWLPGAGRGLLFTLLLALTALLLPVVLEAWAGYRPATGHARGIALLAWTYVVFYAALAAFVRARMGPTAKANWIARAVPVGAVFLAILLPLLAEVILGSRAVGRWEIYRVLDPFSTIAAHDGRPHEPADVLGILLSLTGIVLVLNLVTVWDGVTEITGARRRRRRRGR